MSDFVSGASNLTFAPDAPTGPASQPLVRPVPSGQTFEVNRADQSDTWAGELLQLPSPDFWREEAPRIRGARYLSFDLAGSTFALPLAHVREVDGLPRVAPLPNLPPWVLGAANLRGEIISVVDLVAFLGLGTSHPVRGARLLACRAGTMDAGLVVERVRDIRELPDAAIRPPAGSLPGRAGRFIAGVHAGDGRLTLILDIPRLLHSPEFRRFE